MFDDRDPARRRQNGRPGGEVQASRAVATGSHHVDGASDVDLRIGGESSHCPGEATHFLRVSPLALRAARRVTGDRGIDIAASQLAQEVLRPAPL